MSVAGGRKGTVRCVPGRFGSRHFLQSRSVVIPARSLVVLRPALSPPIFPRAVSAFQVRAVFCFAVPPCCLRFGFRPCFIRMGQALPFLFPRPRLCALSCAPAGLHPLPCFPSPRRIPPLRIFLCSLTAVSFRFPPDHTAGPAHLGSVPCARSVVIPAPLRVVLRPALFPAVFQRTCC